MEPEEFSAFHVPPEPLPPKDWQTGLRFWVRREGLLWGLYWTFRSRRINAAAQEAYSQRLDEWNKEVAETLREKP